MGSFFRDCSVLTEKCSLKPFTWLKRRQIHFYLRFFGPSGMPILPDLLCWWALEVQQYVGAPTASHLKANSATGGFGRLHLVGFLSAAWYKTNLCSEFTVFYPAGRILRFPGGACIETTPCLKRSRVFPKVPDII